MSTPPPTDRAALGHERLAARARRFSLIRRRIVAATLATFALAWGVIAFAGPMGEPTATTASSQAAQTTTATTDDSSASRGSTSSDDSTSSSSDTAPVTTAQS